jgi:hypothetical protein
MNVSASVSGFVFALVVAALLFSAFASPFVLRRVRSWWLSLHLRPFDAESPVEKSAPRATLPTRGHARRSQPPHLEKKRIIGHRSG